MTVVELLGGSGEESSSSCRVISCDVEEVGVVQPDIGRLGTKLLDHGVKQVIGGLFNR